MQTKRATAFSTARAGTTDFGDLGSLLDPALCHRSMAPPAAWNTGLPGQSDLTRRARREMIRPMSTYKITCQAHVPLLSHVQPYKSAVVEVTPADLHSHSASSARIRKGQPANQQRTWPVHVQMLIKLLLKEGMALVPKLCDHVVIVFLFFFSF